MDICNHTGRIELGKMLRSLRKSRKAPLSQDALSEALNVSRQLVSKWERGDRAPTFEQGGVIATRLKLSEAEREAWLRALAIARSKPSDEAYLSQQIAPPRLSPHNPFAQAIREAIARHTAQRIANTCTHETVTESALEKWAEGAPPPSQQEQVFSLGLALSVLEGDRANPTHPASLWHKAALAHAESLPPDVRAYFTKEIPLQHGITTHEGELLDFMRRATGGDPGPYRDLINAAELLRGGLAGALRWLHNVAAMCHFVPNLLPDRFERWREDARALAALFHAEARRLAAEVPVEQAYTAALSGPGAPDEQERAGRAVSALHEARTTKAERAALRAAAPELRREDDLKDRDPTRE